MTGFVIAAAMCEDDVAGLEESLARTRKRVSTRFQNIFPAQPDRHAERKWPKNGVICRQPAGNRRHRHDRSENNPLTIFVRRLGRVALSHRAHGRLDRFMPELLERMDQKPLG